MHTFLKKVTTLRAANGLLLGQFRPVPDASKPPVQKFCHIFVAKLSDFVSNRRIQQFWLRFGRGFDAQIVGCIRVKTPLKL